MKFLYLSLLSIFITVSVHAQDIKLNDPIKKGGLSIMESLDKRQSNIAYTDKELEIQDLSNLLWAANGINRENGKKTAPSAQNSQDVVIYVALPKAIYLFDATSNSLKFVAEGDHREIAKGKKGDAPAPCVLYLVADGSKYSASAYNTEDHRSSMGKVDAGIVSQNISLFCSGMGFGTKPRAQMDHALLKKVAQLSDEQTPILNHPIGYLK